MAAIQVNMRVPEVLLARINAAAGEDRTKWILEACRMRLDGAPTPQFANVLQDEPGVYEQAKRANQLPQGQQPDMAALREICEGKGPSGYRALETVHEVSLAALRLCVACEQAMREVKGKWACYDPSCAMYGKEQKPR